MYRIQIFHPESGFFLNTNHASDDLDDLKAIIRKGIFPGVTYRVVDDKGNEVPATGVSPPRNAEPTVSDIANMLGVPVKERPNGGSDFKA